MDAVLVRNAVIEDVKRILEIRNYEIENSTAIYDYTPKTYDFQLNWFMQKVADKMPVLVIEINKQVLAYGTYGIFRPWDGYQYSVEHSIYVDKNARNLGLGKLLLQKLIDQAKKEGYHTMLAGVDATNLSSINFHKRFGFIEVGTFKQVGHKFNTWLDLLFMQLMLKD